VLHCCLFLFICSAGVKQDISMMVSLLNAYSRCNHHTKAIQLIEKVEEEGWELNKVYCNVVIDTYGFMSKPDQAEKVLNPLCYRYSPLPSACSQCGAWFPLGYA